MNREINRETMRAPQRRHIEYDLLLAALPHAVLVLGEDDRVLYANAAAESFFSLSQAMLKRLKLPEVIAFSSPLGAVVEQVRRTGRQSMNTASTSACRAAGCSASSTCSPAS